jgi:hypothetical protein
VIARTRIYTDGLRAFGVAVSSANNNTDADGIYRLSLEPNEYYLSATYKPPEGTNSEAGSRYAPRTFYPVGTDPLGAVPIKVVAGADTGADIRISNADGVSISGKVAVPALGAPVRGSLDLRLWRIDPQFAPENIATERLMVSAQSETAFNFGNMPPGTYYLVAILGTGPPTWAYSGRMVLEVRDRPMNDIVLALRRNTEFRGRLVFPQGVNTANFRVGLRSSDDTGGGGFFSPEPDGTIRFFNLPEDRYRFAFQGLSGNDYVQDIRIGTTSIYTAGIVEVKGTGPEDLQVILSPNGGSITGVTQTSLKQPLAAKVFLVPEPSRRRNPMFYRQVDSAASGVYQFTGLAPGEYKIFAFETSPPSGSMENAEFLAQFEQRGVPVTVREVQNVAGVTVPIIPKP